MYGFKRILFTEQETLLAIKNGDENDQERPKIADGS